jgi:hypothetical protein
MSDDKIVNLTERRKRDMPVYDGTLVDTSSLLKTLIETLEARGETQLLAACDGWSVMLHKTRVE